MWYFLPWHMLGDVGACQTLLAAVRDTLFARQTVDLGWEFFGTGTSSCRDADCYGMQGTVLPALACPYFLCVERCAGFFLVLCFAVHATQLVLRYKYVSM